MSSEKSLRSFQENRRKLKIKDLSGKESRRLDSIEVALFKKALIEISVCIENQTSEIKDSFFELFPASDYRNSMTRQTIIEALVTRTKGRRNNS